VIKTRYIFFFILLLFTPKLGLSQSIIHVENKRLAGVDTNFSGTIEMSANFVQNVNDIFQTVNKAQIQYAKEKFSFLSMSSYNLTVFNKSRVVNEAYQHFRFGRKVSKNLWSESFVQGQYNEIIKIHSRHLLGTGFRVTLVDKDSIRFFSGTILMGEHEIETTEKLNRHLRLSQYFSIGFPIGKVMTFDFISYFQPDLLNLSDFRTSGEAIFDIHITKRLSFRMVHSLFYDSDPPEEIRNMFYNFRNGLTYRF